MDTKPNLKTNPDSLISVGGDPSDQLEARNHQTAQVLDDREGNERGGGGAKRDAYKWEKCLSSTSRSRDQLDKIVKRLKFMYHFLCLDFHSIAIVISDEATDLES